MATRSLTLVLESNLQTPVPNRGDAVRVRVTAQNAENISPAVFLHQKSLKDPYTEQEVDEYIHVASPFDLSIYPIGDPAEDVLPPYFLLNTVDIIVENTNMAEQAWEAIKQAVQELLYAYGRMERLAQIETVTLTAPAED